MNKTAIVLVGAVASGKTMMANKLGSYLKFEVINEENTGNYFKIINEIDSNKHPRAVYDHCYVYTQIKLFSKEYDDVIVCFLKPSAIILTKNYETRKSDDKSLKGDYLKINPLQQQNNIFLDVLEWEHLINQLHNVNLLTLNIESFDDYEKASMNILGLVKKS